MGTTVCFLGFGEAAQSFCADERWRGEACGYDIKLERAEYSEGKAQDFETYGARALDLVELISRKADTVLSVVTADQALKAAKSAVPHLSPGTLFLDMNSAAPNTKQLVAKLMLERGVNYIDVAIMAPVNPKQLDVPLLLAGAKANDAQKKLSALGFQNIRIVGNQVGQASSIKMLRSVMIKGFEALTAECVMGAARAGVTEEVFGSMGADWLERADYNLDRMMVHGIRRAAEMEEVVKTLEGFGVDPLMSRGTVSRQREIGSLGLTAPPIGLAEKLKALNSISPNSSLKDAAK